MYKWSNALMVRYNNHYLKSEYAVAKKNEIVSLTVSCEDGVYAVYSVVPR